MRYLPILLTPLLLCPAGAALAQEGAAVSEKVIVTAPRLPADVAAIAHDFVASYAAPAIVSGEIPRWDTPICPRTDGLSQDAYTLFVSQRIRTVAMMAGVKVAATPCKPNIEILFTEKPQATLDQIRANHVALLGYHGAITMDHPIQSWYVTATTDLDGKTEVDREIQSDISASGTASGRSSKGTMTWTIPTERVGGYRLRTDLRSGFVNVLIIADTAKTAGHQLGPIADYIAMMALSQTRAFETCRALPSITNLMAEDCDASRRTDGLTDGDLGYLKGVYRMQNDEPADVQRAEIVGEIQKELGGR